ncbi:hypothetical protein GCM10027036_08900 [Flavihumibacter cheonanensis]|uniref:LamG domain-containing protein n=1 Tax=Flavihumibacter fluminis TaxID=2909236 RepID=A0ABS9BDU4_9BACT|nr:MULTISPECIES: LamG domain-containing protein [Flavihumibacter]MCF1713213.1 LamG domain-containing protein [Flavihumibacter fluminis]MCG7751670.1 LamG domain-containing protein [Flavihumibacter cheonanensis]
MKKIFGTLSTFLTFLVLTSYQVTTTSCSKETEIIRDTVTVTDTLRDTVIVRDTILSELEKIRRTINEGLWAYFPVNGSTFDSSGNGRQLNLMNGAALSHDRWGVTGGAINFDGINGYATIPEGEQFNSQNFSVSFYVLTKDYKGLMFGKQDYATANGATFNVGYDAVIDGDKMRFSVTQNQADICNAEPSGSFKAKQNGVLNYYQWYHIGITHENKKMKLYINGVVVDSITHTAQNLNFCNNGEFILGSWWNGDKQSFNGKMDNIRIYSRVLSAKEMNYLSSCDKSPTYVEKTKTDLLTSKTWIYNEYYDQVGSQFARLLYKRGMANNALNLSGDYINFRSNGTFSRVDLNGITQTGTWSFIENETKVRSVENGQVHASTIITLTEDQYVFYDIPYGTYGEMIPKN